MAQALAVNRQAPLSMKEIKEVGLLGEAMVVLPADTVRSLTWHVNSKTTLWVVQDGRRLNTVCYAKNFQCLIVANDSSSVYVRPPRISGYLLEIRLMFLAHILEFLSFLSFGSNISWVNGRQSETKVIFLKLLDGYAKG